MLLEALIGILIFSVGILALIGMQATAMRATIDAKYRSEASFLANEVIGRMWVDRANLASYATASCSGEPSPLSPITAKMNGRWWGWPSVRNAPPAAGISLAPA